MTKFQENLSRPVIIDARARYRAAAQRLRNTALGNLTMSNLTYTAHLLDCQLPTLAVSTKIPFIYLFFVLD